ncbi:MULTISPECIES: sensor histidine kinase [Gardnerella]|jgi:sensor histidine kinase/response regulator|uniref:sensor histidine kinase n=1 Tax=Gardnerella TaxID=2701 RepID=UPI0001C21B8B|nr:MULTISPECIES: HAMP domain-containing sensor histidine kinase [Gardnerella]ADB14404.1 ATPase/histidine kinase/DNA gyrase B/HSP90 domain protein [Gardnerella vaginalis 409-05]RFD73098.1 histidine kinase [Gardnerella vaginalis]RFT34895.1 sensor histidine kinase [Bifidobacteriaceae bacterium NR020]MDK6295276.1 HAMP domain-containing sensor histidine kinase [Gardnerella swidsinskii]MDK7093588.1 HAMP domain-containing sensor histidine kinase [Gardnerella swidsinskii]
MQSSNNNYNNAESTISNSTNNNSKDDSDVRTAGKSVAIELSENNKKNKKPRKTCWLRRRINAIPLSTRLVACTLAILTVAAFCISLSIQQLVGNYLLEKTDVQLASQAQFVYDNVDSLRMKNSNQSSVGPNNYFMQVRDTHNKIISTPLIPIKGSVVSVPKLPADGFDSKKIVTHKPYTAPAIVKGNTNKVDAITKKAATAPWRVLVLTWGQKNSYNSELSVSGYVYIALSLSDQIDTVSTLTRYCIMVSIAVILFGAVFSAIIIQSALRPLKRIEKTASKIASGDLSKRVPSAPENTEVGSLAASLNSMLARIERGFNEQEDMTEKMKRFVSDASHELRTPLAAIHGYAELYTMWRNMPGEQERADDSIAHIKASSERMTELVEDLLSLARFDEGRGINISQQVSLSPILSDAANDLHALDPARSVQQGYLTISDEWKLMSCTNCDFERKLQFHVGTLPTVTLLGDGARLRQVMTNIVGNIHRYTPVDSPVEIAVGVMKASITPNELSKLPSVKESLKEFLEAAEVSQSTDTGHKYAVIRVVDHGPGVPEESLSRIFERFYIADPSRAREKGGTGLGMAIAQSVVKAHHGFICATISSPLEASTNSKTNLDDTMDGSEQIDVKAHGLTLTVVLPVNEIDEPSKIVSD